MSWLDAYPAITQPAILAVALATLVTLVCVLAVRPGLFVPLVICTVPFPKLFSLGIREEVQFSSGWAVASVPGVSLVEFVIGAGIIAFFARAALDRRRERRSPVATPLIWCAAAVLFSLLAGAALGGATFRSSSALYAGRHLLNFVVFFVALRALSGDMHRLGTERTLRLIRITGNAVIVIGLLYYYFGPGHLLHDAERRALALSTADASGLFRTPLFFFDYGYDLGLYLVFVVLLNFDVFLRHRTRARGAVALIAACLGILCITLISQRGNYLALFVAIAFLAYAIERLRRPEQKWTSALLRSAPMVVLAVLLSGVLLVAVAPDFVLNRLERSVGTTEDGQEAEAFVTGVLGTSVVGTWLAELPLGDYTQRLVFMFASLEFAARNPLGVGFWGELTAVGWYAHQDLVKIAVEQGVFGLVVNVFLLHVLWRRRRAAQQETDPRVRHLGLLLGAFLLGLGVTMLLGTAVMMLMKFGTFFWLLIAVQEAALSATPVDARHKLIPRT